MSAGESIILIGVCLLILGTGAHAVSQTYSIVNGEKVEFDENVEQPFVLRKEDATIRSIKDSIVVTNLVIRKGAMTGFITRTREQSALRTTYKDGKKHGEEVHTENSQLVDRGHYEAGVRISRWEYYNNGKLQHYSRQYTDHQDTVRFGEDGKLREIRCSPHASDDDELRKPCGFEGPITHSIHDRKGKVIRVVTFKGGVLQREEAGNTAGATVAYQSGKKHGEERVVDEHGKLRAILHWNNGVQDGLELKYAQNGTKLVQEVLWKAGERQQVTRFYLNGNPEQREVYDSPNQKRVSRFFDTGKIETEGLWVRCEQEFHGYRYSEWCAEGLHKSFYESAQRSSEMHFHLGKLNGTSKRWWQNGQLMEEEEWKDGVRLQYKYWDETGLLKLHEEYEADGSRKRQRAREVPGRLNMPRERTV